MAKRRNQQDNQQPEDESLEIPEDRFEQLEKAGSQPEAEKKSQDKPQPARKPKQAQGPKDAPDKVTEKPGLSGEDLLADVRRTLASEEEVVEPKVGLFARIKNRITKSSKEKDEETEPQPQIEIEEEPEKKLRELVVESKSKKKKSASNKQEEKAIKEFFSDLEALANTVVEDPEPVAPDTQEEKLEETEPEEKVKVPRLPVKSDEDDIDYESIRELALQEYDETKIEVEERKPDLQEDVRRTIRELKPFERMLLIAVGLLTVGALLASGIYIIVDSISVPTPTPTVEADMSEIVHPTRLSLPGGWSFNLGQGRVNAEGTWAPQRAEWLVGTEISRWVALPWSLQLEAVLRTLKSGDEIVLTMSNFDELTFYVYSIQEMPMAELLASDATTPSLLIVLYNDEEADGTFWVVTALP